MVSKKTNTAKTTVLVTGAGGLVGLNLLSILEKKYSVIAIEKNKDRCKLIERLFPTVKTYCADLAELGDWQKLFKEATSVVQLQAQISAPTKEPYVRNNIISVRNVVDACKKYNVKHLIHISSSVVISVANDLYTQTKAEGESIVLHSGLPHTTFRPPLMYGCFDYKHLGYLTRLLEISPVFPVPGSGKYLRQPLFVLDLCDLIVHSIESKPTNKVHNVIGKEKIHFIDLLKIIARKRKLKRLFMPIPVPVFIFMLKSYSLIFGKTPFVKDQLLALMAGDDFPVTNWDKQFKVSYTTFEKGITEAISSPYYKYRSGHKQ